MSRRGPRTELASIIVPCWNQLAFTRLCLRSVFERMRPPFELIVVDDGSTDGTGVYLEGVADAAPAPVTVVRNASNRGFPAAVNQGLRAAKGDHLVLLNNDVVVTDGWLEQLVALAEAEVPGERIGLVGPMSNYASPPQLVEDAPYRDMDQMHAFARRRRDEHRGRWLTAPKLSGFCLLMKRAVYEAVGGLDEGFGLGFFDDDDLAERARRAGFSCAVARDLFVHHFGSRTFVGEGVDAERLLEENGRRFAAKWGLPEGRRVALKPWSADAASSDPRPRPKVSLTMIVRDEEANLGACLGSIAGVFDEIVVVDTGSKDRTMEIAREHGARVFEFPWVDNFAAARNAALARATGDYAFWLDADDVVEPAERAKLEALLAGIRAGDEAAYVVKCACDADGEGGGGQTVVDHIRLFPLRGDVRWTYRVHEQILPSLRKVGVPVRWSDVTVRHTGYSDPALRGRKLERDVRILEQELAQRPDDPFVRFNLGSIAVERCDWSAALEHLGRSLAGSAPTDSITRKLFALIARCRQMLGDLPGAVAVCDEGLRTVSDDAELLFRRAVALRGLARNAEAEASWRRILTMRRPEEFASLDTGIFGHLTRRNLAVLAEERGDHAEAASQWRAVLAECPVDSDGAFGVHRLGGPVAPEHVPWLIPDSLRTVAPAAGPGDFDPYLKAAFDLVVSLQARVVVELGVRRGSSARALLAGVHETDGELWGVDLDDAHGIVDPRFRFIHGDAADCADRWESIDLLHVDTDPHTEEQTLRWFDLYASRCRVIALHDAHHPGFGVGRAVRAFVARGGWDVHEHWGNPSGWTVLTRTKGDEDGESFGLVRPCRTPPSHEPSGD
ncbi:MAG: glycosyltransferase [Paludisphaera borealis]|uniref:glycosyltransferase n=1 Tax=Paludisphaera borealis TaxID=1387353 RepID=UPI00283DD3BD|nr:glycosyltransferase [Paludisphaera borealis]MDR3623060.1 glycosyltransferase [Paludisphaera borealis]